MLSFVMNFIHASAKSSAVQVGDIIDIKTKTIYKLNVESHVQKYIEERKKGEL